MTHLTGLRTNTIADIVRRSAARYPDKTAVVFRDRSWSYPELDQAITDVARHLLAQGLTPGCRVAAYGKNSDLYLFLFLACARAGLIHVPVNYQLTGDELEYILADSGADLVIADQDFSTYVQATDTGRATDFATFESLLEPARTGGEPAGLDEFAATDGDIAQLLYTSGTTSAPKGAIMTHRALVAEYLSAVNVLDFGPTDRQVHALPMYHSAQMHVFLLPALMQGSYNIIVPAPVPGELLAMFAQQSIDTFFAAPTVWVALANHPDLTKVDLSTLRKAYYGASIMPGPVLGRLQELLPDLGFYNCFGQSELGPLCTVLRPEDHAEHPGSAGKPVLFVETRVVDGDGVDVGPGVQGEILYRSPQLCEGYWNKPEATAEAFAGGWFHSGDLVIQDADGFIQVVDRVKDVINTGGVLVAGRQVEDAIFELDNVAEVAVVGLPDEKWIEAVTAYVVPKGPLSAEEVIAHTKTRLAGFKVPKAVHLVETLPKNSAGKILKRELRRAEAS
jgi:fatty-acyl-CoA synthase